MVLVWNGVEAGRSAYSDRVGPHHRIRPVSVFVHTRVLTHRLLSAILSFFVFFPKEETKSSSTLTPTESSYE